MKLKIFNKSLLVLGMMILGLGSANASSDSFCMCQIKEPHSKSINKSSAEITEQDCKTGWKHGTVTRVFYGDLKADTCTPKTVVVHKDQRIQNFIVRPSITPDFKDDSKETAFVIRPSSTPDLKGDSKETGFVIRPSSTPDFKDDSKETGFIIRPSSQPD